MYKPVKILCTTHDYACYILFLWLLNHELKLLLMVTFLTINFLAANIKSTLTKIVSFSAWAISLELIWAAMVAV